MEYLLTGETNRHVLLFVHGLGADYRQFERQHDFFSKDFKVLSISLRGHGNSILHSPYEPKDFTLKKMARDIIMLLNVLGIEKVHYIGNSMGGNIGYEIIRYFPSYVASFTTFGTTAKLKPPKYLIHLMAIFYKLISIKMISRLASRSGTTQYSKDLIRKMVEGTPKSTFINALPLLSDFDYLPVIRLSKIPTLIIQGAKDTEINNVIASTLHEFERHGNFQIKNMKYAGHFANLDNPQLFNHILLDFLNRVKALSQKASKN
ncbi:alpha/beta fold hydrolase [Maribacter sp. 2210JD10-5]|uniref:alpha/beta fold hydrolase n=1 Tax=Maribacter sp. 2210JD10-5 TaxID=3386272 RepID=UPI0039BD23B8